MATKREVTVVINGEEYVSTAAERAGGAMTGFSGKIPGWAKMIGGLAAAYAVVSAAVGALKDYVLDSFAAYDKFASSQSKMAAQSKLTGVALSELNRLADEGREKFGLSTVTANDAATTVGKYASRAGDASKANALLSAALDLGAASGLDAAASMEALEMGLKGQDEGFDKLLGKNPSTIWKEYADANGLAVGKMTDAEKRMAELTAIVEAGNTVQGSYNDRLQSGAGAQDRLNNKMEDAKTQFGQALQPLRIFVVQGLTTLVEVGGRVALAVARVANAIGVVLTGAVEMGRSVVGGFAVALGKLTGNKELEAWGKTQANAFSDFQAQLAKLEKKYLETGTAATDSATKQEAAVVKVSTAAAKEVESTEKQMERMNRAIDAKLGKPMQVAIELTEGAVRKLGQAATDQLPTGQSEKFLTHMQGLVDASGKARDKILGIQGGTTTAATKTKDMAREVEGFARGALDAAGAFGVIDESAQRSLNSAINIASSIGNLAKNGFSFAGVTGIIGGVASIVSTMMQGDAERKRLQKQNNDALSRLSRDIGGLKFNITGEDFTKAQTALGSVVGNLRGGRGAANENDVRNALYKQGLTMEDFERIAKEFGIEVRSKSGALNVDSVKAVFEALGTVQLGKVGGSFQDQLGFFQESQDIAGEEGAGRASNLLRFLQEKGGVGALAGLDLSDPTKLRDQLVALRGRLNSAEGIDEGMLGSLSGGQFNDLLVQIIGLLSPSGGSSTGGTITVPDVADGSGGSVSMPTETIQSVIKTMDNNISVVLTMHTTLHERIAVATEGSYTELQTLNGKMDTLIAVSGGTDRLDKALEEERYALAVQQGRGASY